VSSASSPTPRTPPPSREPGIEDATRRTRLANERTYLAWWRTALAAVAVAVGVGRIAPDVGNTTKWPYEVLGAGYGILAIVFAVSAYTRAQEVEKALASGSFAPIPARHLLLMSAAGAALIVATVVVLFTVN
jgi:inner membrane protein YidH